MMTTTGEPESPWGQTQPQTPQPQSKPVDSGFPTTPTTPTTPTFALPVSGGHRLSIVFLGSGSEYFRIWVVNVLLTLVTLGLYYPWAKARRLRYFYGNTFIGDYALDFHGDPKLMLRGFLLAAAMAVTYSVAGRVSPMAGLIAFIVIAIVWPALFWTSQRFRLANTSWRGLRFRFSGDLGSAYRSMLPLFIPGLLFLGVAAFWGWSDDPRLSRHVSKSVFIVPVGVLVLPFVFWLMKRYQHGNFNLGQIRTELRTGVGSFYGLALKFVGMIMLLPFIFGIGTALFLAAGNAAQTFARFGKSGLAFMVAAILLSYGVMLLVAQPYLASRTQNLVWGRTGSAELRFASDLRFWSLLWLTLRNTLLVIVTLGLYAPFARIASARMRLQAVSVQSMLDPDQLVASVHDHAQPSAAGDAAGDLLGFDIGW